MLVMKKVNYETFMFQSQTIMLQTLERTMHMHVEQIFG